MFRQIVGGVCGDVRTHRAARWTERRTAEMKSERCGVLECVCVCKWI